MGLKKDLLARHAMLLAAANFTDEDLRVLIRELRMTHPDDFADAIRSYRRSLRSERVSVHAPYPISNSGRVDSIADSDFVARVESLVMDAGLSRAQAAEELRRFLHGTAAGKPVAPFNPKDGFSKFLRGLTKDYSLGQILHAAASIRNARVHSPPDDWLDKSDT